MNRISSRHVKGMLKRETAVLYGPTSHRVRLEWMTETGGTLNEPHGIMEEATETVNIQNNIPALWGPVMRDQREKTQLEGLALDIDQLGFWYFANDLNLADKDKLLILHLLKDKYYVGDGTGAGSIWTPDEDPSWTADEWIGYWLVFSDKRYKITNNSTTAVTVDLNSDPGSNALPALSTESEIMKLIKWHPIRQGLDVVAGALSPMAEENIFQSIFVSRIPAVGR